MVSFGALSILLMSILIVFDLNGTLISRESSKKRGNSEELFFERPGGHGFYIHKRPYLKELLEFIKEQNGYFKLGIWTTLHVHWAQAIHYHLFQVTNPDLFEFVLDGSYCSRPLDEMKIPIKNLSTVYNDRDINPLSNWNCKNTILIDDTAEKAIFDSKNLLHIPTFEYTSKRDENLLILQQWLANLKQSQPVNIQEYIQDNNIRFS